MGFAGFVDVEGFTVPHSIAEKVVFFFLFLKLPLFMFNNATCWPVVAGVGALILLIFILICVGDRSPSSSTSQKHEKTKSRKCPPPPRSSQGHLYQG